MFPVSAPHLLRRAVKCWDSRRSVATVISGNKISQHVTERLKKDIEEMNHQLPGFRPGLVVLQVGDRDDSNLYISMKLKAAARIGINANHIRLPKTAREDEVLQSIKLFNEDPDVHGLIVQLPLDSVNPINTERVTNAVDPGKDVDGLCSVNAGKLARGDLQNCFIPCTPNGCMELLRHTGVSVSGKNAVVIGRSKIVGAPMHDLLVWNHATVTCCHSKTPDLPAEVKKADILVVGTGKAEMVKGDWIKEGAVVIDVGINYIPDSSKASGMRVVGDVHYQSAKERAGFITPVPGGVGPMTVAMLMENTVKSAKKFLQTYRPGKWNVTYVNLDPQKPKPSDSQISHCSERKPVHQLAMEIGLFSKEIEPYDRNRVRVSLDVLKRLNKQPDGKYVAVTGITSTPLSEGQHTVALGLAQALAGHLKVNTLACVRQPSLQDCLDFRGAVVGGGCSQITMEEASFLSTGDSEAVSASSGFITDTIKAYCHYQTKLSDQALFDLLVPVRGDYRAFSLSQFNRLQRLGVDKSDFSTLTKDEIRRFVRLDINPDMRTDRASLDREISAVVSLSRSVEDLGDRLAQIVVAYNTSGEPITTEDLGISGVVGLLLKDSLKPCLMQTLEGTPIFLHISPLANVAWGSPSVIADKMALKLVGPQGFVVTETPHLETFLSVTCRSSGLRPHVLVLVTSVQTLKTCGGGGSRVSAGFPSSEHFSKQNIELLMKGCAHLKRRLEVAMVYGVPVVVAVNTFSCDTEAEVEMVCNQAKRFGAVDAVQCRSWSEEGAGGLELAQSVQRAAEIQSTLHFPYQLQMPVIDKVRKAAQQMFGAADVELSAKAKEKLELYIKQGFGHYPVCITDSRRSTSDDAEVRVLPISDIQAYAGAGFLHFVPNVDRAPSAQKSRSPSEKLLKNTFCLQLLLRIIPAVRQEKQLQL